LLHAECQKRSYCRRKSKTWKSSRPLSAAEKLVESGDWEPRQKLLFCDIIMRMRDTGMRNERELYRVRIENINWNDKIIFVPDSKTLAI
jgi:hypothetical protein